MTYDDLKKYLEGVVSGGFLEVAEPANLRKFDESILTQIIHECRLDLIWLWAKSPTIWGGHDEEFQTFGSDLAQYQLQNTSSEDDEDIHLVYATVNTLLQESAYQNVLCYLFNSSCSNEDLNSILKFFERNNWVDSGVKLQFGSNDEKHHVSHVMGLVDSDFAKSRLAYFANRIDNELQYEAVPVASKETDKDSFDVFCSSITKLSYVESAQKVKSYIEQNHSEQVNDSQCLDQQICLLEILLSKTELFVDLDLSPLLLTKYHIWSREQFTGEIALELEDKVNKVVLREHLRRRYIKYDINDIRNMSIKEFMYHLKSEENLEAFLKTLMVDRGEKGYNFNILPQALLFRFERFLFDSDYTEQVDPVYHSLSGSRDRVHNIMKVKYRSQYEYLQTRALLIVKDTQFTQPMDATKISSRFDELAPVSSFVQVSEMANNLLKSKKTESYQSLKTKFESKWKSYLAMCDLNNYEKSFDSSSFSLQTSIIEVLNEFANNELRKDNILLCVLLVLYLVFCQLDSVLAFLILPFSATVFKDSSDFRHTIQQNKERFPRSERIQTFADVTYKRENEEACENPHFVSTFSL